MTAPLQPVPGTQVSDGKGMLTPVFQSWFQQLYTYLSATVAGGGGIVPVTRQINTTAPLAGGGAIGNDLTLTLTVNGVTNTYLAKVPTLTLKGNNTVSTATPQDLTVAQVNAMLPVFTSGLNGLAPLSGGGTVNFLRADGTWAAPTATATTGVNVTPDTHPASPTTADDEFETASLDTTGTRSAGALAWTTINASPITFVQQQGSLQMTVTLGSAWGGIYQTIAAGTAYKYRCKHRMRWSGAGTAVQTCGLWLYESGTGKYLTAGILNNPGPQFWMAWYPNLTTTTQTGNTATASLNNTPGCIESAPFLTQDLKWVYIEIERAGATIYMRASPSGLEGTFVDIGNVATTTAFTTAPDNIGIGTYAINLGGGTNNLVTTDWFRRMA